MEREQTKRVTGILLAAGIVCIVLLYLFADREISRRAASMAGSWLVRGAGAFTHLGDKTVWLALFGLALPCAVTLYWRRGLCRPARLLFHFCVALGLAMIFGDLLKFVFGRARPPLLLEQGMYGFTWFASDGMHHSFPSGHTLRTFAALTVPALHFRKAAWLLLVPAVLEAASRVLVLRHYPSDVLCGAVVGILAAVWADAVLRAPTDSVSRPSAADQ